MRITPMATSNIDNDTVRRIEGDGGRKGFAAIGKPLEQRHVRRHIMGHHIECRHTDARVGEGQADQSDVRGCRNRNNSVHATDGVDQ